MDRPSTSSFRADYFQSEEDRDMSDSGGESPPLKKKRKTYRTGRGKLTLHGFDYQLKLLMLFACNGKNCGVKFSLATEKVDSEFDKFDDLIFRYEDKEDNGKINYRFLQAKHCYKGNKIIKLNDLLWKNDKNNYSLQKYFKSYLIYDQQYQDGHLKDLIICSNDSFDSKTTRNYIEEKLEADPILNVGAKIYQFKKSKKEEIINILKTIFKGALLAKRKGGKVIFLDYFSKKTGIRDRSLLEKCLNKIGNFLDKLVFAVVQPTEADFEKMIAKNIGKEFNVINSGTYDKFYKFMSDWMQRYETGKSMEAQYLTHDDLKKFFDDAKREIASFGMFSSNLLYKAKMGDSELKFKDEIKEIQEMKKFLNNNDTQILIMYHCKALLTGIKVWQILENNHKSDEYIFSDLKSLSILKGSQVDPIMAFKSSTRNLLIIEHNSKKKEYMLKSFIKVLRGNPKKKMILIISKEKKDHMEEVLDDLFKKLKIAKKIKYTESVDESNKLTDLSDESQESVLKKKGTVTFQGKDVTLSSLFEKNTKDLISGEVLSMLVNKEKIEIGKELKDDKYNEIKKYYIERKFSLPRTIKISQNIEKETSKFLIINDNEKPVLNAEDNRDILLISENYDLFMKLCNEHINKNIHLLRKKGNKFVWQQSRGDLLHLRTFIKYSHYVEVFKPDFINDKAIIIVSEPGMGKSMLLTHIALQKKKTSPCLLVLNIKLIAYSSELKRLKRDNNNNEAFVKFLYKTFLKNYTKLTETFLNSITITIEDHKIFIKGNESKIDEVSWLEVQLFNEFYNNGKVVFFFDGFDEICPDYKAEIIDLLKFLKRSRSKIWITSRPYDDINEELENELGVFSYDLERFSRHKQQRYLKKFWGVDDERSDIVVKGLLKHFSKFTKNIENHFLGIPLHLNMLAVVFEKEFKNLYDNDTKIFSITDDKQLLNNLNYLYKKFIDIKFFKIYNNEKMPSLNIDVSSIKLMVIREYNTFLKEHSNLAAYSLLDETGVKLFVSEQELNDMSTKMKHIKVGKEKTGFISHVSDNKPVFVHRTFAEYFLSNFIYDKLKTDSDADNKLWKFLLKEILVRARYAVIRRFLNCLFVGYKVDCNKSEIIKKLLKDLICERTLNINESASFMTPLQVASREGLIEIVKFILENQPDDLENIPDEYFQPDINDCIILNNCISVDGYVKKTFINFGKFHSSLDYAAIYKHEDVVRLLLQNGACVTGATMSSAHAYSSEPVVKLLLGCINSDYAKNFINLSKRITPDQWRTMYLDPSNPSNSATFEIIITQDSHGVNLKDLQGNTLLHMLATLGKNNVRDLLLKGIDIKYKGRVTSPIISKLLHTCDQVRSYRLDRGFKDEIINDGNATSNWVRNVELLLENGADENILNNKGQKPIDLVPDFNKIKDYLDLDSVDF